MPSAPSLVALVAVGVLFTVPGWLLGMLVVPGRLGAATRSALSMALAVPATLVVVLPLAITHTLQRAPLVAALLVFVAVAGGLVLARRPRPRLPWPRLRVRAMTTRQGWRTTTVATGMILVGWIAVVGPQLAATAPDGLPVGSTSWYYWRLTVETLVDRGLPATIVEWGAPRPFPLEYVSFTLHSAAAASLAGLKSAAMQDAYRMAVVLVCLVAATALWRRWLPGWWAFLAGVLTVSTGRLGDSLLGYRPETFGLALVLWSAWLFDEAIERRSRLWAALAGVVSSTAFLAHAEIWLLTAPLWGAILVARLLAPRRRTPIGSATGRWPVVAAAIGAASFAVVVLAVGILVAGPGRIEQLGTRPQLAGTVDQTWDFNRAVYNDVPPTEPPRDFWDPAFQARSTVYPFDTWTMDRGALAFLAICAALVLRRRPHRFERRTWIVLALMVMGVIAISLAIWLYYDTFVPERAGPKRILPFFVLGLTGFVVLVGRAAARSLCRRLRRFSRRLGASAATATVTVILLAALTPAGGGPTTTADRGLSAAGYEALTWMERRLPRDAVVLANAYTDGSVSTLSKRVGWLDGRAPYLEAPAWLADATAMLRRAQGYFAAPLRHVELRDAEVDFVLVARRRSDLGGYPVFPVNATLDRARDLRLVRAFGDGSIRLYAVIRSGQP